MAKDHEARFSDLITSKLSPSQEEVRSLWAPLAQEFDRAGPDAANEYLDAAKQQRVERVESLLNRVEGMIND